MTNTVSVFSAAKRLGEHSGWTLTNLEMQKMLYMAHMYFLGEIQVPLVNGHFEAWALGPVHPVLYHRLKICRADAVRERILASASSIEENHPGLKHLDAAVEELPRHRLVAYTHWQHGAWAKRYQRGVRGIIITNEDIREEYNHWMAIPDEQ